MKEVKSKKTNPFSGTNKQAFLTEVVMIVLVASFFATLSFILSTNINTAKRNLDHAAHHQQKHARAGAAVSPEPLEALLPEQTDLSEELINKLTTLPPPSADCAVVECIALTFDDGPDPASTPQLLDALEREHVLATFFLIGNRVQNSADQVRRMYEFGHLVENHSWSHPDLNRLNAAQTKKQIDLTQNVITGLGLPAPTMFRPPYGNRNNVTRKTVNMPIIMWNVDPKDWREKDPSRIVELVESQAKPGAIILLHDRVATAAALPRILHDLKQRYHLVTVKELLNLPDDARGEFFGR